MTSSIGSPTTGFVLVRLGGDEPFVNRQIAVDHAIDREVTEDRVAASRRVGQTRGDTLGQSVDITTNPSVHAVLHDFLDGAASERDDWRAARHRLDHDEPEGLLPL